MIHKNKILFIITVLVVLITIAILSAEIVLHIEKQKDEIYVWGLNEKEISIPLKNQLEYYTGADYVFTSKEDKDEIFLKISKNYPIFERTEYHIDFKVKNEICSLYYDEENQQYRFGSNFFNYFKKDFPVPLCQIEKPLGKRRFKVKCDMDYLRRFYKCYSDMEIYDNHIKYHGICVTYKNGIIKFSKSSKT